MEKLLIYAWLLCSVGYCLDLDSFMLETLDETRLLLEKTRVTDASRSILPSRPRPSSSRRRTSGNKGPVMPRKRAIKASLNKFLHATNQIEKGIRDAGAMRRGQSIEILKQQIKAACNSNEYLFARQMLGHTIYSYAKGKAGSRRGRRGAVGTPSALALSNIRSMIGDDKFIKLMAFDGLVTLAFAIDTTGSMFREIKSAKKIATDIINWQRSGAVDYILSPFNDPTAPGNPSQNKTQHGIVRYSNSSKKQTFLQYIAKLEASGGGDCKEMAIEGMQNIFTASIQFQSPIYVFTDAGAKDGSTVNVEALILTAESCETPINFFLSNAGCMTKKAIDLYKLIADSTGGQILFFTSSTTLNKMSKFVTQSLIGGANIPVISNRLYRRSTSNIEYSIQVDNSMDVLSATVMTTAENSNVQLHTPGGSLHVSGKINTGKGALFLVSKPTKGVWKLSIPQSAGDHFATARCVSEENIDFDFFFIVETRLGTRSKQLTSKTPLKGKKASLIITVPAHSRTRPASYKIQVVNNVFKLPQAVTLKQHGRSPGRYAGEFVAPSYDFKLILEGLTREGVRFKRLCNGIIKATSVVMHVLSAPRGFFLKAGSSSATTILFAANNFGSNEAFTLKIKEQKKFVLRHPKRLFLVRGRMALFPVSFKAPRGAKRGTTYEVVITAVGKRSGTRASLLVALLVV